MIVLNCSDGSSTKFELSNEEQRKKFDAIGKSTDKSKIVTGIWVNVGKQRITLPYPKRFRRVYFYCEVMNDSEGNIRGEQIVVQADDVRMIVTSYCKDGMTRVDMRKTRQVFKPERD